MTFPVQTLEYTELKVDFRLTFRLETQELLEIVSISRIIFFEEFTFHEHYYDISALSLFETFQTGNRKPLNLCRVFWVTNRKLFGRICPKKRENTVLCGCGFGPQFERVDSDNRMRGFFFHSSTFPLIWKKSMHKKLKCCFMIRITYRI